MPVSKSAKKALRSSLRKAAVNKPIRSLISGKIKQLQNKPNELNLTKTFSILDKAAKKNVIHPNKANRLKSRLAHYLKKSVSSAQ